MVYNLPIIEERVKPHQITTLHMVCALAFIVAGTIIVVYNYTIPIWGAAILIAGITLTILVMAKNMWVTGKKVNQIFRIAELVIASGISIYSFIQQWKFPAGIFGILSAAVLFALYWERTSTSELSVHIDNEGIKLPVTARRRFKPWTDIEEVLFRFGILTINFTDNSYMQWDIASADLDKDTFETYCSKQVEENRGKRRNDDW